MTSTIHSRREILQATGVMVVALALPDVALAQQAGGAAGAVAARAVEPETLDSWLVISRDGSVTVYTGRVDLGTGTEIALAQFAAEELDVPVGRVKVVMGDSRLTPDQGKTTASLNMTRGSQPIRVVAAEARAALVRLASERLGVPATELTVVDGVVRPKSAGSGGIAYGELIGDRRFDIKLELSGRTPEDIARGVMLKPRAPLKPFKDYKIVGQSVPRPEIPAKVAGTYQFVHNVRVPGMLHGRVVRPPTIGARLLSVDAGSISGVTGAQVVRRNDFLGVVAPLEEDAIEAARRLKAQWSATAPLPDMATHYDDLVRQKVIREEKTFDAGNVEAGLAKGKHRIKATYDFPFQDHGMIGPSCGVADVRPDGATLWSGSQWPQGDRSDIAAMLGLPLDKVHLVWHKAAGCFGRLAVDDALADAAVMSQIVGRPVRVQWMRHEEHGWEPVSPAMRMVVEAACDEGGRITGLDYRQWSPSHSTGEKGNHLAWHAIGGAPGHGRLSGAAAQLVYAVADRRAVNVYVEPWLRGVYLRSPGGIQSFFAYESIVDELAAAAGVDALEMRLRNTPDRRDRDVLEAVAKLSGWQSRPGPRRDQDGAAVMTGRGICLTRYGAGSSRSAFVADVEVERATGKVRVSRASIAFDCGLVINPDGLLNQIEGGVVQGISRALHERKLFDRGKVTSLDWRSYPILTFSELPEVRTQLVPRPDVAWGSAGEAGHVAAAAAVANAVFDATGKRPRRLPLTPDYVKTLL